MMVPRKIDEREEANVLERASDGSRAAQHEESVVGRVIDASAGVIARHQEEQVDRAAGRLEGAESDGRYAASSLFLVPGVLILLYLQFLLQPVGHRLRREQCPG